MPGVRGPWFSVFPYLTRVAGRAVSDYSISWFLIA